MMRVLLDARYATLERARYAKRIVRVTAPSAGVDPQSEALIRKRGGVGLGVAVVQEIRDAHGGRLLFERLPLGGLKARPILADTPAAKAPERVSARVSE